MGARLLAARVGEETPAPGPSGVVAGLLRAPCLEEQMLKRITHLLQTRQQRVAAKLRPSSRRGCAVFVARDDEAKSASSPSLISKQMPLSVLLAADSSYDADFCGC